MVDNNENNSMGQKTVVINATQGFSHTASSPNAMNEKLQQLINQGMAAVKEKQWQVGLDLLSQAVLLSSQTPVLWEYLGMCAVHLQKFEAAYLHTTRLIWIQPDNVIAHLNRGRIAEKLNMVEEAIADFNFVITSPKATPAHIAEAGVILISLYRDRASNETEIKFAFDVIAILEKLPPEAIEPVKGKFLRHRLFTYIKSGDYKKGFAYYEVRNNPNIKLFSQPIWGGLPHHEDKNLWQGTESLKGKTILVAAEQGFGDVIQFVRLMPDFCALVKKQGAKKIILEVYDNLAVLLQMAPVCKDVEVIARGGAVPSFDYWFKMGSLPYYLQLTIGTIPFSDKKNAVYITAPSSEKKPLPKVAGRKKIGLVWSSSVVSNDNSLRSLPSLKSLLPLWDAADCDFYSLQVGEAAKEIVTIGMEAALLDLSPHLKNFSDTAKFANEMDLIITIDSAVMHIAGALGKPLWVMAPYATDWRLGLGKCHKPYVSPWYPTSQIFRCAKPGDWDPVVALIQEKLISKKFTEA
ncbi:MAG: glycosyltransferase family 9 protein [Alphaproteobacteria bacterium]